MLGPRFEVLEFEVSTRSAAAAAAAIGCTVGQIANVAATIKSLILNTNLAVHGEQGTRLARMRLRTRDARTMEAEE